MNALRRFWILFCIPIAAVASIVLPIRLIIAFIILIVLLFAKGVTD